MTKGNKHARPLIFNIMLGLVVCIISSAIAMTFYLQDVMSDKMQTRFADDTKLATQRLLDNFHSYESVLYSARALLLSSDMVTQQEWQTYFASQGTLQKNPGISSISYIQVVPHSQKQAFIARQRLEKEFGSNFTISPAGDRDAYAVAALSVSAHDVNQVYGFDVFSSPARRATYETADALNRPVGSKPLKLQTGHYGFFIALPIKKKASEEKSYVLISFRINDLLSTTSSLIPSGLGADISDTSDPKKPIGLFQTKDWAMIGEGFSRRDTVTFAERTWQIEYRSPRGYDDPLTAAMLPRLILVIAATLSACIILAYVTYERRLAAKNQ